MLTIAGNPEDIWRIIASTAITGTVSNFSYVSNNDDGPASPGGALRPLAQRAGSHAQWGKQQLVGPARFELATS